MQATGFLWDVGRFPSRSAIPRSQANTGWAGSIAVERGILLNQGNDVLYFEGLGDEVVGAS